MEKATALLQLPANTFFRNLQFAAFSDFDRLLRLVARLLVHVLDLVDDLVALEHLSEDDVAAIEPGCDGSGDEELASVGVFARVGHAEHAFLAVLELEVLIGEFGAVDGLATGSWVSQYCVRRENSIQRTVTVGEVTALDHEILDDTVEGRAFISKALLASSQSTEVLSRFWGRLAVEANDDTANIIVAMCNVEVDLAMPISFRTASSELCGAYLVCDPGSFARSFRCLGEVDEGKGQDDQEGNHKALESSHADGVVMEGVLGIAVLMRGGCRLKRSPEWKGVFETTKLQGLERLASMVGG